MLFIIVIERLALLWERSGVVETVVRGGDAPGSGAKMPGTSSRQVHSADSGVKIISAPASTRRIILAAVGALALVATAVTVGVTMSGDGDSVAPSPPRLPPTRPPARPPPASPPTAASNAAALILNLLRENNGTGSWGDRADLMGLLVRLAFHDGASFDGHNQTSAGGSDGCVDLESIENRGLEMAVSLLAPVVAHVDGFLSRGDVWALAGNLMIEAAGGPRLEYRIGRPAAEQCAGHGARHVSSEAGHAQIFADFVTRLGFTPRQVVALLGAHVLGRASAANSGYVGPWVPTNDEFTNRYFVDLLDKPWVSLVDNNVPPFGRRTTWRRTEGGMGLQAEIMLQTDIELAFDVDSGFCSRAGGPIVGSSCPRATHDFSAHVDDFARDQPAWFGAFRTAWARLTTMNAPGLVCAEPDCQTPQVP